MDMHYKRTEATVSSLAKLALELQMENEELPIEKLSIATFYDDLVTKRIEASPTPQDRTKKYKIILSLPHMYYVFAMYIKTNILSYARKEVSGLNPNGTSVSREWTGQCQSMEDSKPSSSQRNEGSSVS